MKKFLLFAAAASVALVSCVNDEKMEMTSDVQKISFDNPVMATQTRAEVTGEIYGTEYPEKEEFVVYAKQHAGPLATWAAASSFWNKTNDDPIIVKKEGTYWEEKNNTDYYWPKASTEDIQLSFAAYSPAGLGTTPPTVSYEATGLTVDGFTVESTVASQIDFMYSERVLNQKRTTDTDAAVGITFKHALSSIVFSAIDTDDAATYKIHTVQITGDFAQSGKFEEGVTDGASYSNASGYPKWTPAAAASTTYQPILTAAFDVPTGTGTVFTGNDAASGKTSAILPIPQSVPDNAEVTITYTRSSTDGDVNYTVSKKLKDFKDGSNNTIENWAIGNRYTYHFIFGKTPKIYFSPTVTDWIDGGTVSIEI